MWLPLLFLAVEAWLRTRKSTYALLGGIVLSMQVLAGHPQYLFYSTVAVFMYVVLRVAIDARQQSAKRFLALLRGLVVLCATGVLLSAVQTPPPFKFTPPTPPQGVTFHMGSYFS